MLKLIAVAAFALAVTSSAEAMTPAPVHQPQGMITHVAFGCGVGRTRINGVCVSRARIRHARRCLRWGGGFCHRWGW